MQALPVTQLQIRPKPQAFLARSKARNNHRFHSCAREQWRRRITRHLMTKLPLWPSSHGSHPRNPRCPPPPPPPNHLLSLPPPSPPSLRYETGAFNPRAGGGKSNASPPGGRSIAAGGGGFVFAQNSGVVSWRSASARGELASFA